MQQDVVLHMYDLSNGMARSMSQSLLGIELEAIWHTGIVVGQPAREYFFGGGIFHDRPGATQYGVPLKRLVLGQTTKTVAEFEAFLDSIRPRYRMQDYSLLDHNCNNFTNECSMFLLGKGIPQDIIDLPKRALSTPLGSMIRPAIESYQQSMVSQYADIDASITGASAGAPASNPHAHLQVPLLTLGKPVPHDMGALFPPVERLRHLLGASVPLPAPVVALGSLSNAAALVALPAPSIGPLVSALFALVPQLAEPDRYPIWDLLRLTALHPACDLAPFAQTLYDDVLGAATKLSQIAALRLVQNALLRPGPLVALPHDVATARCIARGLASDQQGVRKAAAMAGYNFSLARSTPEALVVLVSAAHGAIKAHQDPLDSHETLAYVLTIGTACYGSPGVATAVRSIDLAPLLACPNAQVQQAAQALEMVLKA